MQLECLDAQGTFLQHFTFDSIGFLYEANIERERGRKGEGMGANTHSVRQYRSGETLLNSLLQEWNLNLTLFVFWFGCRNYPWIFSCFFSEFMYD